MGIGNLAGDPVAPMSPVSEVTARLCLQTFGDDRSTSPFSLDCSDSACDSPSDLVPTPILLDSYILTAEEMCMDRAQSSPNGKKRKMIGFGGAVEEELRKSLIKSKPLRKLELEILPVYDEPVALCSRSMVRSDSVPCTPTMAFEDVDYEMKLPHFFTTYWASTITNETV
jgi:hypothetical protein